MPEPLMYRDARFLVVDDQESNLIWLTHLLRKAGFSNIHTLDNSRYALATVQALQPDCILLDMHMPHLSGLEVLQQVRANANPDVFLPIVMLTASSDEEVKRRALTAGASDFLTRPINSTELLLRITNLLQIRQLTGSLLTQKNTLEQRVAERTQLLQEEHEQAKQATARFEALAELSSRIEVLHDPTEVAREGLRAMSSLTGLEIGVTFNAVEKELQAEVLIGTVPETARGVLRPRALGKPGGILKQVLEAGGPVIINNYDAWEQAIVKASGLKTVVAVPLTVNGKLHSILFLGSFQQELSADAAWLPLLSAVARRVERAVARSQLMTHLRHTKHEALRVVGLTLEYRDYETKGHTDRVTRLALRLGRALGLSERQLRDLSWGGYLHDAGKVAIPDHILLKPGRLDAEEFEIVKRHVSIGEEMLRHISFLPPEVFGIIRHHHERWDGSGYPDRLGGEEIPLLARIFSVCDVYDALTCERPYKPAWSHEKAMAELHRQQGQQFDPQVVEAFTVMCG